MWCFTRHKDHNFFVCSNLCFLDPNPDNLNDLQEMISSQTKTGVFGKFEIGTYAYFAEEMKAAPRR